MLRYRACDAGRRRGKLAGWPHWRPSRIRVRRPELSEDQQEQLCDLLVEGARAAGYDSDLWTCRRVTALIQRHFGVSYHFNHVGRLLHALGFSPQKPLRRARERDEEAIERWRRRGLAADQKKGRRLQSQHRVSR